MSQTMDRRRFLKTAGVTTAGFWVAGKVEKRFAMVPAGDDR